MPRFGLGFNLGLAANAGGDTPFSQWMWASGTRNLTGFVQYQRTFTTYMWADGYRWLGGKVDYARNF